MAKLAATLQHHIGMKYVLRTTAVPTKLIKWRN